MRPCLPPTLIVPGLASAATLLGLPGRPVSFTAPYSREAAVRGVLARADERREGQRLALVAVVLGVQGGRGAWNGIEGLLAGEQEVLPGQLKSVRVSSGASPSRSSVCRRR